MRSANLKFQMRWEFYVPNESVRISNVCVCCDFCFRKITLSYPIHLIKSNRRISIYTLRIHVSLTSSFLPLSSLLLLPTLLVPTETSGFETMAGGAVMAPGASKGYPGKMTLYVFVTCLVASSGGLIFGYDIGISGNISFIPRCIDSASLPI